MAQRNRKPDQSDALFHAYGEAGPDPEIASLCFNEAGSVQYADARVRYADIENGISVREGMDRRNWEFFRPGEHLPRKKNEIISVANEIYRRNGIVKFVINLMTDFVTRGIEVYHPAASKQNRYRHWWRKVGGRQVSRKLVNLLYRHGCAIPKINFGVLNAGDIRDLQAGSAADGLPADMVADKEAVEKDVRFERSPRVGRHRIPLKYTFLNPITVEAIGGELSLFAGTPSYGLKIPDTLLKAIKAAKTIEEKMIIASLPSYLTDTIGTGKRLVPLDPEKTSVLFYDKDDWALWPDPMVLCILKDLILYEAMKDADRAALDGAIRSVRLWRLGLPEYKIQPGPGAFRRLRDQLLAAQSGSSIDIIWDATLDFKESNTNVHQFLGSEKYQPVLQAIYAGLGIPQSLAGGKAGSMTGDALNLKTLIERLQPARDILDEFWERQFFLIQKAFGDRQPAQLRYDLMSLSDDAAQQKIWLDLFDRQIATKETVREKFGLLHNVEEARQKRNDKLVDNEDVPAQIGPFIEAAPHPGQILKGAMQQGTVSPTEAGAKKKPKAKGDKSLLDHQADQQKETLKLDKEKMANDQKLAEEKLKTDQKQAGDLHQQRLQQNDDLHKQRLTQKDAEHKVMLPVKTQALKSQLKAKAKGQPGQGRPLGQLDSSKRKKRVDVPRTGTASLLASQAQARTLLREISPGVNQAYLSEIGKGNLRQLSSAQAAELEERRFAALMAGSPATSGDASRPGPQVTGLEDARAVLAELREEAYGKLGVEPTVEDMRELYVTTYALLVTESV